MKWLIRMFFRSVRRILGPVVLFIEKLTTPKGVQRPAEAQQILDATTGQFALYQFKTCPFCMKVRREIKRQSLNIELRDAQHDQNHREQLLAGGGQIKVPCLQIRNANGEVEWLYESDNVIQYLRHIAA